MSRVALPEKLPAAAALALSRDGSRLLLATPDALLLVIDTSKAEVSAPSSPTRCRLKFIGLVWCAGSNMPRSCTDLAGYIAVREVCTLLWLPDMSAGVLSFVVHSSSVWRGLCR